MRYPEHERQQDYQNNQGKETLHNKKSAMAPA
jgi:hypothetical protein